MQKISAILLVDDDSTTNYLNELLLNSMDITAQVLIAENGQQALQTLARICPKPEAPTYPVLVLLDVNMPIMSGIEFLEAYQQLSLSQQRSLVIVMLTTSLHPRDLARINALPVAGLLSKPLTRSKVNQLLKEHFKLTS